jgi:CelD/BcsL family acetyltransferase involved in cellulose biosynthesis
VDALLEPWEALADRVGGSPFKRPGWVAAWWRAFGRGRGRGRGRGGGNDRLEILASHGAIGPDARLSAVLPVIPGRWAVASPSNWHSPDFGPLTEDPVAGTELLAELFEDRPTQVSLGFLNNSEPAVTQLEAAAESAGYRVLVRPLERSLFVDLDGDWADFERGLSRGLRRDLRRRRRRLAESGRVWLDVREDTAQLDEALALEHSGWKRERGSSILSHPQTTAFYTDVATWAARTGRLRLSFLRVGERAVATHLALEDGGVYLPLKGGFDPAFAAYSPGKLILLATLERSFAAGLRRYELLGDEDEYKRRFATGDYDRVLFQAFAPTPAGQARWFAFVHGRPLAKRALDGAFRWRNRKSVSR